MTDSFIAHNGVDWTESPKYLWPRPSNEDREFWEGARRGELRIQRCLSCGKQTLEWITASGLATIYSFTVVRQNGVPPFSERLPFVVAVLDLDEAGARMIAAMPRLAPEDARIGMRAKADFRPATDEAAFVDFAPAD